MTVAYLLEHPFVLVLAVLVATVGVARLTRLITYDTYPPVAWLRSKWQGLTRDGEWSKLATCGFCAAPYLMAACLLWGVFTAFHWSWWAFWGWLALSYVSSMIFARDEPAED